MSDKSSGQETLLSPSMTGGITGGKGYDFQTRYIVCHFPEWTKNPAFVSLVHEGTGDVDLRHERNGATTIIHIQIKDHEVTPAILREAIETFVRVDTQFAGIYKKFILACPSLSASIRSIENGLQRLLGVAPFYAEIPDALTPTKEALTERLTRLNLAEHAEFILEKVEFQTGVTAPSKDDNAIIFFRGQIVNHPRYEEKFRGVMNSAYALMLQHVLANRGKTIDASALDRMVTESFREALRLSEPRIVVNLHNWTREKLPFNCDKELDWSSYFERETRKTPTPDIWQNTLIPQLRELKTDLANNRSDRLIMFQGKACLSSGIAFGATFPKNGGWTIELRQPPTEVLWRSDAAVNSSYNITVEEEHLDANGDSIVLLFNITGRARDAVKAAIDDLKLSAKALLIVSPESSPGSSAIKNDTEAVSLAQRARDALHQVLAQHQAGKTHIFFYGPQALAIFLGQRLTAVGEVFLYEYKDPGYLPSCHFRT